MKASPASLRRTAPSPRSAATAVFLVLLWVLGDVILPFVLGGALAYCLDPIADWFERMGLSRMASTIVITLLASLVFILLALLVIPTLIQQTVNLVQTAPQIIQTVQTLLTERFPDVLFESCAAGADLPARLRARARELRNQGRKPYLIPVGGSNAVGALGYVRCAAELMAQCLERDVRMTRVVHASGSGGTQAGLVAGFRDLGANTEVIGISVSADRVTQRRKVRRVANELWDLMGLEKTVPAAAIQVHARYVGEGYGIPTDAIPSRPGMASRSATMTRRRC